MAGKNSIAVVDDDESVRRAIGRLLQSSGYDFTGYESADDFLNPDNFRVPDCLVLDLTMPGLDGFGLIKRLDNQGFTFPVIIITAHGDDNYRQRARFAGATDFLPKPFTNTEILEAIRVALSSSPRSQEDHVGGRS